MDDYDFDDEATTYKSGSLFSFPMHSPASRKYGKSGLRNRQVYDDHLFPKNLLGFSISDSDVEEDSEQMPIDQKINLFTKQRKEFMEKYAMPTTKIQKIVLRPDKKVIQKDPEYIPNDNFLELLKIEEENLNSLAKQSILNTGSMTDSSVPEPFLDSNRAKPPRSRWSRKLQGKNVDLELNDSMINVIEMEIEEDFPIWLQSLPAASPNKKKTSTKAVSHSSTEKLLMIEDPVEQAMKTALARQSKHVEIEVPSELVDLPSEEMFDSSLLQSSRLSDSPKPYTKRTMSAAELNADWGFQDESIGKKIRQFMKSQK